MKKEKKKKKKTKKKKKKKKMMMMMMMMMMIDDDDDWYGILPQIFLSNPEPLIFSMILVQYTFVPVPFHGPSLSVHTWYLWQTPKALDVDTPARPNTPDIKASSQHGKEEWGRAYLD